MSDAGARTLWESAGLVDAGHRLVWATGADAISFLHDLLSQNVAGLAQGEAARSLLLAPNGRLRALIALARIGDAVAMISAQSDHLLADLTRFRIRVEVDLTVDQERVSMVWGPAAEAVITGSEWPTGVDVEAGSPQWALKDPFVDDRWFVIGSPDSLGVPGVPDEEAHVRRIEIGEPQFGVDVDQSTIPNEAFDLVALVDFQKGCYLGQELVERIDARGRRVKRLTGVVFEQGPVPHAGATLRSAGADVGTVTSTALSPSLGAPIGLGTIRSEVEDGGTVVAHGDSGTITGVVTPPPLLTDS